MTGWSAVRQVIGLEDIPLIRCDRVRVRVEFGYEAYGPSAKGSAMADSIYSVSEIVGSSTEGIDDAIRGAVTRASKTLHNLDWFEVTNTRGRIESDGRTHFQVTLKVGFRLDDPSA
jgi:flavin-binding protein dodecin